MWPVKTDPLARSAAVSVLSTTPVLKRSTNPIYAPKDPIFDLLIFLSLADKLGVVELVVWDKDMLTKQYLGEVALPLDDWFRGRKARHLGSTILVIRWVRNSRFLPKLIYRYDSQPFSANFVSAQASTPATGATPIKLGLVEAPNTQSTMDFQENYTELVRRSRPSLICTPPVRPFISTHSLTNPLAHAIRQIPSAHTSTTPNTKTTGG